MTQLRQVRIADLIANRLRKQILSGELADGASLPPIETLLEEFQVSRPSLREAFGILETEGLLSVNRGRAGGARVHTPTASRAAYQLALVLDLKGCAVADVGEALRVLEPLCASMCAARKDRAKTVLPILQDHCDRAAAVVDDGDAFVTASRRFHESLVELCGNQVIQELVGMLQVLWSAHEDRWVDRLHETHEDFPAVETRKSGVKAHQRIIDRIADGDAGRAGEATSLHLEHCQTWPLEAARDVAVSAALILE